jgi:hypothetical protein
MNHAAGINPQTHLQHPPEMQLVWSAYARENGWSLKDNAYKQKHQRNSKSNLITININAIIQNLINIGRPTTA